MEEKRKMLSTFRSHAKGWIAWVFVILVSVPFALWGIGQYRSLITTDYVAKVNGAKIMPQRLQNAYEQAFQQRQNEMNGKFNPTPKEQLALKKQTLQQLINSTLLLQQARNDRLLTSNSAVSQQISQIPAFQANGHFNYQQYKSVLASNGLTVQQFENEVRSQLLSQQLESGLAETTLPTTKEVEALAAMLQQQRKVAWFVLPLKGFMPSAPPSETAVQAYYKAHQDRYSIPETVTLSYLQLDKKSLMSRVKVTPEALHDYYRTHQSQYGIPPARKVAEILIKPSATSATAEASAMSKAQGLLGKIKAAKDPQAEFASLARKDSDDPISRRNGGSIGYVSRGQLPEKLDNAVFGLKKIGATAGPIQTGNGWVLLQLLDKRGGSVRPFDKVKAQVATDYKTQKAKDLYYKLDGDFANLTYEHAGTLEVAAKKLGLPVQTVSGVTRDQGKGIAKDAKVRKAAFSDGVMKQHQNSNPIKLGDENAVVIRVSNVTPSKARPLDQVRKDIVSALSRREAREAASDAGKRALAALRGGQSMTAVAKAHDAKLQGPEQIKRSASKLPGPLLQAVFTMAPAPGSKARYAAVEMPDGGQAVYALLGVQPGQVDKMKAAEKTAYATQLGRIYAQQTGEDYLNWLRSQADIKIVESNIQ